MFASVYDNHWFFASNDLATLEGVARSCRSPPGRNSETSLQDERSFSAAQKHLPADYAGMVFLDPQPFVEKLLPVIAMTGQSLPPNQLEAAEIVRSVAATLGFDHGKMRETDFVAMPRVGAEKKLARRSLDGAARTHFSTRRRKSNGLKTFLRHRLRPRSVCRRFCNN